MGTTRLESQDPRRLEINNPLDNQNLNNFSPPPKIVRQLSMSNGFAMPFFSPKAMRFAQLSLAEGKEPSLQAKSPASNATMTKK